MRFEIERNPAGLPAHDFGYALTQTINYQNWYAGQEIHNFRLMEDPKAVGFPVGSLEFVDRAIRTKEPGFQAKPLNLPENLTRFAGREIEYVKKEEAARMLEAAGQLFIKDASRYKGITGIVSTQEELELYPEVPLLCSEVLSFRSEHRVFVFEDSIQGIRLYQGDDWTIPDRGAVLEMIDAYRDAAPPAYTLDVAVTEDGRTLPVEVHPFVSCGLYGFCDHRILIPMTIQGFKWYRNHQAEGYKRKTG